MNLLIVGSLLLSASHAQETVDIGVLKNEDIQVVQNLLYPKANKTELSFQLGVMPFDAFLTTPNLQVGLDLHQSESVALSFALGGGYGLERAISRQLQSPTFGVAGYAYRYLGSALGGMTYSPWYGKVAVSGKKVVHYDIYGALRGGVTLEQSIFPDGAIAVSPTVSPAIGFRFFTSEKLAIRCEFRDDLMVQRRKLTEKWYFKQNLNVGLGISLLSGGSK